jgi:hypothetical protein
VYRMNYEAALALFTNIQNTTGIGICRNNIAIGARSYCANIVGHVR